MHLDESTWGDTLEEWKATHQQQHQHEFETLLTRTAIPTDQDSNSTSSPYPSSPDPPASTAQRLKRLRQELALVADNPHMTFFQPQKNSPIPVPTPPSSQPSSLPATLEGPPHSPYAHGIFHIAITLPPNWPATPPKMRFLTPIYHPDIDEAGIVHVEFLGGDWCPALTLEKVLYMLCAILSDAWPGEGGEERGRFEGEARKWTGRFAGVERGVGLSLDMDRLGGDGDGDGDGERG